MHTFFALEDMYGLKIKEVDGELCLRLDKFDYPTYSSMYKMFHAWQLETAKEAETAEKKEAKRINQIISDFV